MPKWIIEKLDTKRHGREQFDCGIEVLNAFLKFRANQEQKKRLNVTYVAVSVEDNNPKSIMGFYTLSNSALALYFVEPNLTRHIPPTYDIPTVKIGRLAVEKSMHGQGIGQALLRDACHRIVEMSAFSGIKGLEVLAKNGEAARFYESFGFHPLLDNKETLFLPIETIIRSI